MPAGYLCLVLHAHLPFVRHPEYEDFLERFRHARSPQEEQRYLYALAGFRQAELLTQTLQRTLDGEIRSQDAPYVVRAILASVWGRGQAWEFVKGHWETMRRLYPPSAFRRMFDGVSALVRPEWEAEVRSLYDGMVRIVVTPTWAKLIDFETTLPSAVEELVRQREERQRA